MKQDTECHLMKQHLLKDLELMKLKLFGEIKYFWNMFVLC